MRKFLLLTLLTILGGASSVKADVEKITLDQLKAGYGSDSEWKTIADGISYPIDVKDGTLFGSDGGSQTTNADVKDYDYLYVTVTNFTANKAVRIFFWDKYQNKRVDYYLKPEADKETANFESPSNITGNGTYCVKVPDGARLQGAKPALGSSSDVSFKFSEIYLTERETPYVELIPYTLEWTPNAGTYRATIPLSESHIRTTGNVSINYATGEVTNTGSGTLVIYLNNEDLVGATGYNLTTESGSLLGANLDITDAVNGEVGGIYSSRNSWYIAGDDSRRDKIGAVKAFKYIFSDGKGSAKITSIYFDSDLLIAGTTQKNLADMPYGRWGLPANQVSNYIEADASKTNNIGAGDQSLIYGHDAVGDVYKYVDLTNCSKIIFTGLSSDGKLRLFYNWDGTEGGKSTAMITDFPTSSDTYEFDIEAFKKLNSINFFHLFGIKASQWDTKANISDIKVVEYTNVISGSGIDKTKNYRSNPYITSIDATGLTNSSAIELTSANPNCLFIANSGKLSNSKNVIVSGTCANLVLTDNKPFKAPAAFTATDASYDRSFTADKMTTVCLPFALTSDEASDLGTFYGLSSVDGTVITFSEVDEPAANTPYLVIPTSTTLSIGGKSIAATPAETRSSASNIEFIGTLAATGIPASEGSNNYYAFNNGELVRIAEKSATLPAFRAYIKATGDVGVKAFTIQFDDATGVNSLFTMDDAASSKFNDL